MLGLPPTLIRQIFDNLSVKDVLACSATCRSFNDIVTSSVSIQLKLYRYLYNNTIQESAECTGKEQTIYDGLVDLISTQNNIRRLKPNIVDFKLSTDELIIEGYGDRYITLPTEHFAVPSAEDSIQYVVGTLYSRNIGERDFASKKLTLPFAVRPYQIEYSLKYNVTVGLRIVDRDDHISIYVINLPQTFDNNSPLPYTVFDIPFRAETRQGKPTFIQLENETRMIVRSGRHVKVIDLLQKRTIAEIDVPPDCMGSFGIHALDPRRLIVYVNFDRDINDMNGRSSGEREACLLYYRLNNTSDLKTFETLPKTYKSTESLLVRPELQLVLPKTIGDLIKYVKNPMGIPEVEVEDVAQHPLRITMASMDDTGKYIRFHMTSRSNRAVVPHVLSIAIPIKHLDSLGRVYKDSLDPTVRRGDSNNPEWQSVPHDFWLQQAYVYQYENKGVIDRFEVNFGNRLVILEQPICKAPAGVMPIQVSLIEQNGRVAKLPDDWSGFTRLGGLSHEEIIPLEEFAKDEKETTLPQKYQDIKYSTDHGNGVVSKQSGTFLLPDKTGIARVFFDGQRIHVIRQDGQINVLDFSHSKSSLMTTNQLINNKFDIFRNTVLRV